MKLRPSRAMDSTDAAPPEPADLPALQATHVTQNANAITHEGRDERVVSATHAVLFKDDGCPACDACGAIIGEDDADDEPFSVSGSGLYVWTRGTEVRYEEAPLCASCAAAIGVTALARWEIEEEEG